MRHVYRFCFFTFFLSAVVAAWGQAAPTVTLTATCTAPCNAPATITLSATTAVASGRAVSKVELYDGATLLATDTTFPYSSTRTAVVGGSHNFTAKVYDNAATPLTGVSATKVVTVNTAPTVALVATCGANLCVAPATVILTATPADADGSISKVEFYRGTTLISTKTAAPWTFTDSALAAGTYGYTAKAFDNAATPLSVTSAVQSITVATAPTITLTAACTAPCNAPASITVTATTTVASGRAVSKVEFYEGTTLLSTDTTSPFSITLASVTGGTHAYTAKVYDNATTPLSATSSTVNVVVNTAPTISLTATCNATPCSAPARVTLAATPADVDGGISKVEFHRGTTLITTKTAAPWTYSDSALSAGSYSYTAKTFDSAATPLSTTSAARTITVVAPVALPTVTLVAVCTAPCNAPAAITLTATTTVASARAVSKVELYDGATLLATDTTSPYSSTRTSVTGGIHAYTAKVYDNATTPLSATSTAINVAVNTAPTVALVATCNATPCSAPASVALTATPADADGAISKVEFYRGATLLATKTAAPWTHADAALAAGSYSYTAIAFDNGATALTAVTSAQSLVVSASTAASVSLSASCPNSPCMVPVSVDLVASPTVANGRTVARVEYYDGAQLLGKTTGAPHQYRHTIEAAGVHSFTAKVYDSSMSASVAVSAPQLVNYASMDVAVTCAQPCDTGATLALTASNIVVPGETISRVEFFDRVRTHPSYFYTPPEVSVGFANSAPWTLTIPNAAWGEHFFSARAFTNAGAIYPVALAGNISQAVGPPVVLSVICMAPCIEPAAVNYSVDARYRPSGTVYDALGNPHDIDPGRYVSVRDGPFLVGEKYALPIDLPFAGTVANVRSGTHIFEAFVTVRNPDLSISSLGTSTQSISVAALPSQFATLVPDNLPTSLSVATGQDMLYKLSAQSGDHFSLLLQNAMADDSGTKVTYSMGSEFCSSVFPQVAPNFGDLATHGNLLVWSSLASADCVRSTPITFNAPAAQILNMSAFGPTALTLRLARPDAPAAQSFLATLMRHEQLPITPNGATATIAPVLAGRAQRYEFNLSANQRFSVVASQLGLNGYGVDFGLVTPLQPDRLITSAIAATGLTVLRATDSGTHTIVASQKSAISGTANLAINTATSLGVLQTDGVFLPWLPARSGAMAATVFNAVAGHIYNIAATPIGPRNGHAVQIYIDDATGTSMVAGGYTFDTVEFTPAQSGLLTVTLVAIESTPRLINISALDGLPSVSFANTNALPACPTAPYVNEVVVAPAGYVDAVFVSATQPGVMGSAGVANITGAGPYSFAWSGYEVGRTYSFSATALLKNGVTVTSEAMSVTFPASPTVLIDCAIAGGSLTTNDDQFSFTGDISGAKNASIFVNNTRVPLDEQGRFLVNNIPLVPGTNTVAVLVNQLSGHTTLTYNITRSGAPSFSIGLARDVGYQPFTTTLTVINRDNLPWQRIVVSPTDGVGSDNVIVSSLLGSTATARLDWPVKGRYRVRIRVYGVNNSVLFETFRHVLVTTPGDDIALVAETFTGMTQALTAGNIPAALNHFTDEALPKYRTVFNALAPRLAEFAGNYPLVVQNIGRAGSTTLFPNSAEMLVSRVKGGRYYGYRVYFVRDSLDGLWRIHEM